MAFEAFTIRDESALRGVDIGGGKLIAPVIFY